MARVFSAVDVEQTELLEELERVRDRLDLGFNPVETGRMHITLQFFKDVDRKEIESLEEAMEDLSSESFEAEVKGVGAFPSREYIRVVWAGVENEKLKRLYSQVSDHEVEEDSDNEFSPHITMMRVRDISPGKKGKLQKTMEEFEDHVFGRLKVDRVKLFESSLGPKGPEYSVLHEKEL